MPSLAATPDSYPVSSKALGNIHCPLSKGTSETTCDAISTSCSGVGSQLISDNDEEEAVRTSDVDTAISDGTSHEALSDGTWHDGHLFSCPPAASDELGADEFIARYTCRHRHVGIDM